MKIFFTILLATLINGCSKSDGVLTPNQRTENLLKSQVWKLTETRIDGMVTNLYDGLTLSFGSKIYSSVNGGTIWPTSGTWTLVDNNGDLILRDNFLSIEIVSADSSQLVLTFTWGSTTYDKGRTGSLKGFYRMTFLSKK